MANQLISLGGSLLTDEGRTYNVTNDERAVVQELANGSTKKYVKSVKRRHSISWTWLCNSAASTIDGGLGRDAVISLYGTGGTYQIAVTEISGSWSANVMFDSYSETLLRRDIASSLAWYEVSIVLKEV